MRDLAKMSIDELQALLAQVTDPTSASPAEAVLQSKSILFLSGEIAVLKEALSNNASNLNGTLGVTNKSIKELRESIKDSIEKVMASNKKLAESQTITSVAMAFLTLALVIVGVSQVSIMNKQLNIMSSQTEIMKKQLNEQINNQNDFRDNKSIEYAEFYDQQLSSGKNHEISVDLEKGRPILKGNGGKFLTSDLDVYLGLYNSLDLTFDSKKITGELIYSYFADDLIRAYQNHEIQNYLKKRRVEDEDNFRGFDDLAEYCLKVLKERKMGS